MNFSNLWKKITAGLIVLLLLAFGAAWWGYTHLTGMVQARLRDVVGNDLTIGTVTARWNRVELEQVRLARHGAGPFDRRIAIGRVVLRPRLVSLFSGRLELADISIESPYLLLEIAPDGSFVRPFPTQQPRRITAPGGPSIPVTVGSLHISGGSVDILDWHIARNKGVVGVSNPGDGYHLLRLDNLDLAMGKLDAPLADRRTPLKLSFRFHGGGDLTLRGDLSPKSLDSHLRLDITGLNITRFRPYFLKQGDLGVSAGTVALGSDISIEKRLLKAPGTITLKNLALQKAGTKGALLGVPAWALVKFMSDSHDELKVAFSLNGSLDNPRFTIRQSLMEQIASALSSKIGVPTVTSVGKGIIGIGEKSIKGVMGIFGGK